MQITAIITAAGKGTRAGLKTNKVLNAFEDGKTVLERATLPFDEDERITELIFTASEEDYDKILKISQTFKTPSIVVKGGETRTESVKAALEKVNGEFVLIHDAARPYVTAQIVDNCVKTLLTRGSAITCTPCVNTIGNISPDGAITHTSRSDKRVIQTPQGFMTCDIKKAFSLIEKDDIFTDEAGAYCKYIGRAYPCEGSRENIKLTYPEDFTLPGNVRAGTGFDLHRLTENRKLILGGIDIPFEKGLLGHSDADVLTHAVMDALLSAAALKDIGCYFSDKDPEYKDISSMILLSRVLKMIKDEGYKVNNVSAVIMAEKPKLTPYADIIKKNLATALEIPVCNVGLSCTTLEGVGLIGTEQAMAASAVCTIFKNNK